MRSGLVGAAAALLLVSAGAAGAATLHFKAHLAGAAEVPPNTTTGTGDLTATLDTTSHAFTYHVTYSGLTGPATAAHFHGPAAPGKNAPPVVPVKNPASPIDGHATLTRTQTSNLEKGMWYFNVHTAAHPGGEIRGQVTRTK
ncbi:MAG TPA: CHRD domain-containing protein [Caulobacteraceae bacterium]|nr:CHRD domain-containing protein [Caulobacteraceae bacterium]